MEVANVLYDGILQARIVSSVVDIYRPVIVALVCNSNNPSFTSVCRALTIKDGLDIEVL